MKYINPKGIVILLVILVVFQFAVGMVLSPFVGKIVVDMINRTSDTKVEVGRISVWPLTLGFSINGLRIFDPDDESKQMISVKKASARLSPLALLSKRFVIAGISADEVEIDLVGEPDGSFNLSDIVKPEEAPEERPGPSIFDRFKKDKDMFSRIFRMIRSKNPADGEKAAEKRKPGKIKTDVMKIPKGRRVDFKIERTDYLLDIRDIRVRPAVITVKDATGDRIDIKDASLRITGLKLDPVKGAGFKSLQMAGDLNKAGEPAGSFNLTYDTSYSGNDIKTRAELSARKVDLPAVEFLFEDSMPVEVARGVITINSTTRITNGKLDSRNRLTLVDHLLEPKGKGKVAGVIPMPVICEALNDTDPLKLNFDITGTVNSPKFTGLEDTVKEIAQPYLTKKIEGTARSALEGFMKKDTGGTPGGEGGSAEKTAEEAVKSIKSLFGKE